LGLFSKGHKKLKNGRIGKMAKFNGFFKILGIFIFLVGFTLEGNAMGGLSKVMFSEVQGVVLKEGKPLAGAKVVRTFNWAWNNAKQKDEVMTDASGKFNFESVSRSSLITSIFPHEPIVDQEIKIIYGNKEYMAWFFTKHNYDENGELKGKKINIKCDISVEAGQHINSDIWGICTLSQ
jgi:hypothetical protein